MSKTKPIGKDNQVLNRKKGNSPKGNPVKGNSPKGNPGKGRGKSISGTPKRNPKTRSNSKK